MHRIKLYIYTKNANYGEKLARFMAAGSNPDIEVELLTEVTDKTEMQREAYIISDDVWVLEHAACQTIRLVKVPETAGKQEVFMYQRRDDICGQIRNIVGAEMPGREMANSSSSSEVICVFSYGEHTEFALETAVDRAERGNVLYVSLSGFPVIVNGEIGEKPVLGGRGISELMLCEDIGIFEHTLKEIAFPLGKISVIAPAEHFRDLFDFRPEEVVRLLLHFKQQKLFDFIVIETGQLYEFTFSLLEGADEVIMPKERGFFASAKRNLWQEYCRQEGCERLPERIRLIPVETGKAKDKEAVCKLLFGEGG